MSTGDHLTLGAVAALAALGFASRRRRGSRAKTPPGRDRGSDEAMVRILGVDAARNMQQYAYLFEDDVPAPRKTTRRSSVTQPPKTRKKTAAKKTPAKKVAPKKSVVTAKQQTMISQVLKKMGKLTADEKKTYTAKLSALTEDQVRQLKRQCDQEAA